MTQPAPPPATVLIVPVDLAVCCVGTVDAQGPAQWFAGGTTDYRTQATTRRPAFLGENVIRDSDQAPLWSLETGVHLHWAMPDALTRASGDPAVFPPLPNRWVVTRIVGAGTAVRHWLVRSDALSDTAPGGNVVPTVPTQTESGTRGYAYLGATEPLEAVGEPAEQTRALLTLTGSELHAAETGDLAFTAFYPNARGVFGYHDDLTDLTDAPVELTYVVTGWYDLADNDPLHGGMTEDGLRGALGWTLAGDQQASPTSSVYSGLIQGVVWNPATRYLEDTPTPVAADVAVGNHPAEALAAYLRGTLHPDLKGFEDLTTLYAAGLLPTLATPSAGQLAELDEVLHTLQFAAVDGGTVYRLTRGTAEVTTLPLPLADALNALNAAGQAADAAAEEVTQAKWQLFADWVRVFAVDPSDTAAQTAALNAFYDTSTRQPGVQANLTAAAGELSRQQTLVSAMLPDGVTLTAAPATRYHTGTEPVVLLAGDAAAPALRYGGDGRFHPAGYLVCRLDTDILRSLSIGTTPLRADQYTRLAPAGTGLPAPAGPLVTEAALLSSVIGAAASGIAAATLAADLAAWTEHGTATCYQDPVGTPPSPVGLAAWPGENPWTSLMLLWEADFHPLQDTRNPQATYSTGFFTDNYRLDPDKPREIAYAPAADGIVVDPATIDFDPTHQSSGTHAVTGRATLSATSADNLRDRLAKDPATTTDPTLQAIAGLLAGTDIAMQSVSGFNDTLLSRKRALQLSIGLPPNPPLPFHSVTKDLTSVVTDLAQIPSLAPDVNGGYDGMRAGYLHLSLRVMDPFGRKRPVAIGNVFLAGDLTATSQGQPVPRTVYLPPRLAQPSRLLWRWLAADATEAQEANEHPATTPVCGWLLPSHLGVGFFCYDAQGQPLGSLTLSDDGSRVIWQSAPGEHDTVGEDLETVLRHQNPHLRAVAEALAASTPARFREIWTATDTAVTLVSPPAQNSAAGMGVLVSRPLAVVQAALTLERHGLAATDQTMATLDGSTFRVTDRGVGDVRLPVVVGDLDRLDDGLAGYFKQATDGKYDTSVFYTEAASGTVAGVVAPATTNLLLTPFAATADSPGATPTPTKVLMLVDPRAPVHATTGVLPTQSIAIPPEDYQRALGVLEITVPATPLLRPAAGMVVPFPELPGYHQSWITEVVDDGRPAWSVDPELQSPASGAVWQYSPQTLTEGWLRLNPELLRFGLANTDGTPVVTAGTTTTLVLTVRNDFTGPITVTPGRLTGEDQPNTGSVLYVHLGALVTGADVALIRVTTTGWSSAPLHDARHGDYLAITPTAPVTLPPDEAVTLTLASVAVEDAAPAQARVYLDYDGLDGAPDGVAETVLTVRPR